MGKLTISTFIKCTVSGRDDVNIQGIQVSQECLYSLNKFKFLDVSLVYNSQLGQLQLLSGEEQVIKSVSVRRSNWLTELESVLIDVGKNLGKYGLI